MFVSTTFDKICEDIKMDCSINESAIVPTVNAVSICENKPSFYLTTPMRNLLDCSNDQLLPAKIEQSKDSDETEKENNSTEVRIRRKKHLC